MANMQCLLGLQCTNFVMVAADQMNIMSIIVIKDDEDKLHEIADNQLMGVIGDSGDAIQFSEFVSKNLQLYKMRNRYSLDTAAVVHFTRKSLADNLRGGTPSMLNLLVAGYDAGGCHLYSVDLLATCIKVPFAAHGFGGLLSLSILDKYYKSSLTEIEAYEVLKLCIHEIHQRLLINLPNFQVKAVSRGGVHGLPAITPDSFKFIVHTESSWPLLIQILQEPYRSVSWFRHIAKSYCKIKRIGNEVFLQHYDPD